MNKLRFNEIRAKYSSFYETNESLPNIENSLSNFLFSEIYDDIRSKGIHTFNDWLVYYSENGEQFTEITKLIASYFEKVLKNEFSAITFDERVLIFNAIALYSIEMQVEPVEDVKLRGIIIQTFIEIIHHYDLYLKKYLSLKGDILISDRNKCKFYTVWSANGIEKEVPITLFS